MVKYTVYQPLPCGDNDFVKRFDTEQEAISYVKAANSYKKYEPYPFSIPLIIKKTKVTQVIACSN